MGARGAEDAGGPGRDAGEGAVPGRRLPRRGLLALLRLVYAAGPVPRGHHVEAAPGGTLRVRWAPCLVSENAPLRGRGGTGRAARVAPNAGSAVVLRSGRPAPSFLPPSYPRPERAGRRATPRTLDWVVATTCESSNPEGGSELSERRFNRVPNPAHLFASGLKSVCVCSSRQRGPLMPL